MSEPVLTCAITGKPCDPTAVLCSCVSCFAWCDRNLEPLTPERIEEAAFADGLRAAKACRLAMTPGRRR